MLLPLFTFVAAFFGLTNRADEPVGRGLHVDGSSKALTAGSGFFRAVSFHFRLTSFLTRQRGNSQLCLPAPRLLNAVVKFWRTGVTTHALLNFHTPENSLTICFSLIIFSFAPRSIKKFVLEAAPGIAQEISKACRQSRKERSRSMT